MALRIITTRDRNGQEQWRYVDPRGIVRHPNTRAPMVPIVGPYGPTAVCAPETAEDRRTRTNRERLALMAADVWNVRHTATRPDAFMVDGIALRDLRGSLRTPDVWESPTWETIPTHPSVAHVPDRLPVHEVEALVHRIADQCDAFEMPGADVVIATSLDPMAVTRWSLMLEHMGTEILHAYGMPATRPDVLPKGKARRVVRTDPVAHTGQVRYALPRACRYGAIGKLPGSEERTRVVTFTADGVPMTTHEALTELRTTLAKASDGSRRGWVGFRPYVFVPAPRKAGRKATARRKADRAARAERNAATRAESGNGSRGPAVTPWARSTRSLAAAVATAGASDVVTYAESILRTSADGASVTLGPCTVVVHLQAEVVDHGGRAYPIREWCRRAALAHGAALTD